LICAVVVGATACRFAFAQEQPAIEPLNAVSEWGVTISKGLLAVLEIGANPDKAGEISLGATGELAGAAVGAAAGRFTGWATDQPLVGTATGAVFGAVLGYAAQRQAAQVGSALDNIRHALRDQLAEAGKLGQERDHLNSCLAVAHASASAVNQADIQQLRGQLGPVATDLEDLESSLTNDLNQMAALLPLTAAAQIKKVDLPSFGTRLRQDFQVLDQVAGSSEEAYDCGQASGSSSQ